MEQVPVQLIHDRNSHGIDARHGGFCSYKPFSLSAPYTSRKPLFDRCFASEMVSNRSDKLSIPESPFNQNACAECPIGHFRQSRHTRFSGGNDSSRVVCNVALCADNYEQQNQHRNTSVPMHSAKALTSAPSIAPCGRLGQLRCRSAAPGAGR